MGRWDTSIRWRDAFVVYAGGQRSFVWGENMAHAVLFASAATLFFAAGLIGRLVYPRATFDLFYHDTYYVFATWTYVLAAGGLFSSFAGIAVAYPWVTGRHLDRFLGHVHFWVSFVAVVGVLVCAQVFAVTTIPPSHESWHGTLLTLALLSCLLAVLAQLVLVTNLVVSFFRGQRVRA